jgi:hypothetical protein
MLTLLASAILLQTPAAGKFIVPAYTGYIVSAQDPADPAPSYSDKGIVFPGRRGGRVDFIGYLNKGSLGVKPLSIGMLWRITIGNEIRTFSYGAHQFDIKSAGYKRIIFESAGPEELQGHLFEGFQLLGPATEGAKFNLKERRNAPSVHLKYPLQPDEKVEWFYNEIRPQTDNPATYYQACGFHRGYFGIQVNSPTERRIIFSVWDSGDVPDDRAKVKREDLVTCLEKGKDVVAEGFGNEGTGGHSHLVYNWKTQDIHRFLVHAQPDGDKTIYTGYYWFNETKKWGLIAKFRAPKDGSYMKGLYSFNENFWGDNGDQLFAARFGPGWVRRADGSWRELTNATFSCDKTGREDRFDYSAGTKDGLFFLTNGGAVANGVKYGDPLVRPASKTGPPKYLP